MLFPAAGDWPALRLAPCRLCVTFVHLPLKFCSAPRPSVHTRAWRPERGGFRENLSKRQLDPGIRSASYRHTYLPPSWAGVKLVLTLLNFLPKCTARWPESTLRASIVARGNCYFIYVSFFKVNHKIGKQIMIIMNYYSCSYFIHRSINPVVLTFFNAVTF